MFVCVSYCLSPSILTKQIRKTISNHPVSTWLSCLTCDLWQEGLAHGDNALSRAHDGAFEHHPVLLHLTIVGKATHRSDRLLREIILRLGVHRIFLRKKKHRVKHTKKNMFFQKKFGTSLKRNWKKTGGCQAKLYASSTSSFQPYINHIWSTGILQAYYDSHIWEVFLKKTLETKQNNHKITIRSRFWWLLFVFSNSLRFFPMR